MNWTTRSTTVVLTFLLLFGTPIFSSEILLKNGLAELRNKNNQEATEIFRSIINNPNLSTLHAEATYWLIKTEILLRNYKTASELTEKFFAFYPNNPHQTEIKYHQARLLYLRGEPDKAIVALGDFIVRNPQSPFISSAIYWNGESLMALGHLEEAEKVFTNLIKAYPASVKREASRYRLNEITFLYRERLLLDLLRWSHEDHLKDAEDFHRREKEYQQAIEPSRSLQNQRTNINRNKNPQVEELQELRRSLTELREKYNDEN